jgi:hypothetical protein
MIPPSWRECFPDVIDARVPKRLSRLSLEQEGCLVKSGDHETREGGYLAGMLRKT